MAIFKAEDVVIAIDGEELAASSVTFSSSLRREEDRRYGERVESDGFRISGPNTSTLQVDFFLTGSGTKGHNPVFGLLSGLDTYSTSAASAQLLGLYKPVMFNASDSPDFPVYIQERVDDSEGDTYKGEASSLYYDGGWFAVDSLGSDSNEADAVAQWPWDTTWAEGTMKRTGWMGCITGSKISFGGTEFASGAALTNFSITISPFAPVRCRMDFSIFNEVTTAFQTGAASISVPSNNIAHGMYSTYSGAFSNVDEVSSINISYSAERAPRYVIGKKEVHEIQTTKATKTVTFNGYGRSATLEQPSDNIVITLGSANKSDIFTDETSGIVIDDSFAIPNVGIISKNVKIVQNLL